MEVFHTVKNRRKYDLQKVIKMNRIKQKTELFRYPTFMHRFQIRRIVFCCVSI